MISDLNKPNTVLKYAIIICTWALWLKWQLYWLLFPLQIICTKRKITKLYANSFHSIYLILGDNEEIEDIKTGLRIWDKYIKDLKAELAILVPTASDKSTARTNLENKR